MAGRRTKSAPAVAPLLVAGKQFRPEAEFHKPVVLAPLPLFKFVQLASAAWEKQVLVDRVVGVVLKRMGA